MAKLKTKINSIVLTTGNTYVIQQHRSKQLDQITKLDKGIDKIKSLDST